jgi:hypothetical protein
MSMRAKVKAAVDKAFVAIGDLAVSATLSKNSSSGYDFASGSIVSTTTTSTVKVVLESKTKPTGDPTSAQALMKSGQQVGGYDTLTIGTDVYNISSFTDDGFIITLSLTKGGC